jgi:hypothetical protein
MSGQKINTKAKSDFSFIRNQSNTRNRINDYDSWERAYFPYLIDMYKITFDDPYPDHRCMSMFFKFIYSVSSGKISPFLRELSKPEEEAYIEFKLKNNN